MRIKIVFGIILLAGLAVLAATTPASGLSLKLQPGLYNDTLGEGEKKKGFIDISNPTGETLQLVTSVQAFRQIDDQGSLEFYDSEQIEAGITPDLEEFTLGPREALRMYFLLDGTKLPAGDVFGALFVSSASDDDRPGVDESVRLGTLFTLVNGTPGAREASVSGLDLRWLQLGDDIRGSYQVTNTADPETASGFYPEVVVSASPFGGEQTVTSPLTFAGITRTSDFSFDGNRLGVFQVAASYGDSSQSRWVLAITGYWRIVAIVLIFLLIVGIAFVVSRRRRRKHYFVR